MPQCSIFQTVSELWRMLGRVGHRFLSAQSMPGDVCVKRSCTELGKLT